MFTPRDGVYPRMNLVAMTVRFGGIIFPRPLTPVVPGCSPLEASGMVPFDTFIKAPSLRCTLYESHASGDFFMWSVLGASFLFVLFCGWGFAARDVGAPLAFSMEFLYLGFATVLCTTFRLSPSVLSSAGCSLCVVIN